MWHINSKVLGGFYQSDIFVVAKSREEAIDQACTAFSEHIDKAIDDLYFASVGDEYLDPDDDDYEQRREAVITRFRAEADEQIYPVENNRIVRSSS